VDWHARFRQQAGWTQDLRMYLFERARIAKGQAILEVGCGTGAILTDSMLSPAAVHGLDIDPFQLAEAKIHAPGARLTCGDALYLPFHDAVFDVTFCHFLLLWVKEPLKVLNEMKRVTHPGGTVLAIAEPDYSSRVDKPDSLATLGRWQTESLRLQGADPNIGAQLAELFSDAGIQIIETGLLQQEERKTNISNYERDLEWAVLEADLQGTVSREELQRMKDLDEQAWGIGTRILYVPTYFAYGMV
jgi:ubiquinone/menaquinone biosynthesis C-methylase UbiE